MEFDSIKQKAIVLAEEKTDFDWPGSDLHNSRRVGRLVSQTRDFIPICRNQSGKAEKDVKLGHLERSKFRTWILHQAAIFFQPQDSFNQTKLTVNGEVHKA